MEFVGRNAEMERLDGLCRRRHGGLAVLTGRRRVGKTRLLVGELRKIATGRKAWLFVGSDDHGTSAGHLFSLIASARLHRLDPEEYLRDLFRVLGQWPRDRYIELAPKYWSKTRACLDPVELANEVGPLTIPPAPQEQVPSS